MSFPLSRGCLVSKQLPMIFSVHIHSEHSHKRLFLFSSSDMLLSIYSQLHLLYRMHPIQWYASLVFTNTHLYRPTSLLYTDLYVFLLECFISLHRMDIFSTTIELIVFRKCNQCDSVRSDNTIVTPCHTTTCYYMLRFFHHVTIAYGRERRNVVDNYRYPLSILP